MNRTKDTWKNRIKSRKAASESDQRGFTLAELMLVVAITVILAGIAFIGIFAYRRQLKRLEMDETAQEIYVIAQNHLAKEKESGSLDPDKLPADPDFWGYAGKRSSDGKDLYYIQHASSENFHSTKNDTILDYMLPTGAIDETVSVGGQYIIAYDRENLQVLEVFYTDTPIKEFDWKAANDDKYRKCKKERENFGKLRNIIGYYGGGSLSFDQLSLDKVSLHVSNGNRLSAVIYYPVNTDKASERKDKGTEKSINLVVRGLSSSAVYTRKVGTVTVSKSGTVSVKHDSSLPSGFQVKDIDPFRPISTKKTELYGIGLILDDITHKGSHFSELFYDSNESGNNNTFIPGEDIELYAYISQDNAPVSDQESNHVVTNSLFAQVSPDQEEDGAVIADVAVAGISNIRHLENLDPSISNLDTTNAHNIIYSWKDGQVTGRTIGGKKDTKFKAETAADRTSYQNFYHISKAEQQGDLYWSVEKEASDDDADTSDQARKPVPFYDTEKGTLSINKDHVFTDYTAGTIYLNENAQLKQASAAVPAGYIGIDNPAITSYDGKNLKIYNLNGIAPVLEGTGTKQGSYNAGLFRYAEKPLALKNVFLIKSSFIAESESATGLSGNAGSLCAESGAALTITHCFVTGTVSTNLGHYAGGLVGMSKNELHIADSGVYAAEPETGKDYRSTYYASYSQTDRPRIGNTFTPAIYSEGSNAKAGGLVGYVRTKDENFVDGGNREISIQNSFAAVSVGTQYSSFINEDGEDENECAGGLIGAVKNDGSGIKLTITDSYAGGMTSPADPSVYSESVPNVSAPFAGGAVGYFYEGNVLCDIARTYSTAAVSNVSGMDAGSKSAIGGFIGYIAMKPSTRVSLDQVYSAGAVYNTASIDGAAAGTFIGYFSDANALSVADGQGSFAGGLEGVSEDFSAIGDPENLSEDFSLEKSDITYRAGSLYVAAIPYSRSEAGYPYFNWTTADTDSEQAQTETHLHYGDWPAADLEPEEAYLAYRDQHDSDTSYGYYAMDPDGKVYDGTAGHTLKGISRLDYNSEEPIKNENAEYGILTTESDPAKLKLASGSDLLNIVTGKNYKVPGSDYYFYPLEKSGKISIDRKNTSPIANISVKFDEDSKAAIKKLTADSKIVIPLQNDLDIDTKVRKVSLNIPGDNTYYLHAGEKNLEFDLGDVNDSDLKNYVDLSVKRGKKDSTYHWEISNNGDSSQDYLDIPVNSTNEMVLTFTVSNDYVCIYDGTNSIRINLPASAYTSVEKTVPYYGIKSITFKDTKEKTLYYNDAFAKAISSKRDGLNSTAYLVRTARQFYNMNHYPDSAFVQAANLDLSRLPAEEASEASGNRGVNGDAAVFGPDIFYEEVLQNGGSTSDLLNKYILPGYKGASVIAGIFSGSYTGSYDAKYDSYARLTEEHQYRIENLKISHYTTYAGNDYAGLFEWNKGTLDHINLSGKMELEEKEIDGKGKSSYIGSIAAFNQGSLVSAASSVPVTADLDATSYKNGNDYYVGGLIGYTDSSAGVASIEKSKYHVSESDLSYSMNINLDADAVKNAASSLYCGGLAGYAYGSGKIDSSYVHAAINNSALSGNYYYGGMLGGAENAGNQAIVENSYASIAFKNDGIFSVEKPGSNSTSGEQYHTGLWIGNVQLQNGANAFGNNYAVERRIGPSNRVIPASHRLESDVQVTYTAASAGGMESYKATGNAGGVYSYVSSNITDTSASGGAIILGDSDEAPTDQYYKAGVYDSETDADSQEGRKTVYGMRAVFYSDDTLVSRLSSLMTGHANLNGNDYLPTFIWDGVNAPLDLLTSVGIPPELMIVSGEFTG